jgi:hypothetical protein
MPVGVNEILTYLGVFVGGIILTLAGYSKKPGPGENPLVTGVGLELGNRFQTDQVIHQLTRIADSLAALADRREAARDEMMKEMLDRLDESERRNRP